MPQMRLPHKDVYVRLKPSRLHGIGVFAVRPIKKGTYIFPKDDERLVWVPYSRIQRLAPSLQDLYRDFSIIKQGKYGSPRRFDQLTPSWYLNESKQPNVGADKTYRFYATRDIKTGEELTVDYKTYSELPNGDRSKSARLVTRKGLRQRSGVRKASRARSISHPSKADTP